jgi:antitoxin (DNA-binding transcriptional repressor) of toxin-antitoxin stability system
VQNNQEVLDFKNIDEQLKKIIRRVSKGKHIILKHKQKPVAQITPILKRTPGLHHNKIQTSDDFDKPLPDEFWTQ